MYSTTKTFILFIITFSNVDHTTAVEGLLIFPHTRHSLQLSSMGYLPCHILDIRFKGHPRVYVTVELSLPV